MGVRLAISTALDQRRTCGIAARFPDQRRHTRSNQPEEGLSSPFKHPLKLRGLRRKKARPELQFPDGLDERVAIRVSFDIMSLLRSNLMRRPALFDRPARCNTCVSNLFAACRTFTGDRPHSLRPSILS